MGRVICGLLVAVLLGSCSHLRESDVVGPEIRGTWSGEGRFLDRELAKEYGTFPVGIDVHADNSVSGTVGKATLSAGVVKRRPEDFLIEGRLEGAVFESGSLPAEKKDSVVLILAPPENAATTGDIHLKSGRSFDVRMRVCGVKLARGQ